MKGLQICAECGNPFRAAGAVCPRCVSGTLSAVGGTMDALVENASIPSLGSLIRGAKNKGLLKPMQNYGDSA